MHICIITQNHLCRNPRVLKEAELWAKTGHNVSIGTLWYDKNLIELDKILILETEGFDRIEYNPYINICNSNIRSLYARVRFQLARILKKYYKYETIHLGGYGVNKVIPWLISKQPDLISCHQEIACLLTKEMTKNKFKFFVDFEDWYSRDLLPSDQKLRPIQMLKESEKYSIKNGLFTLAPSQAMADSLHLEYGGIKPHVIYNSFSIKLRDKINIQNKNKSDSNKFKVAWISQWIGQGRGLEKMIDFIQRIEEDIEIHLAGNIKDTYKNELNKIALRTGKNPIFYYPIQRPDSIVAWLKQFDAGLASEPSISQSTDMTVSNKMFYYLLAGLPIIAFHTKGQAEIALKAPNSIILCDKNPESEMIIRSWVRNREKYNEAQKESYDLGTRMCWESQSQKLLEILNTRSSNEYE
jgi:glycosyltransferase involved in cell wall biosynthesis